MLKILKNSRGPMVVGASSKQRIGHQKPVAWVDIVIAWDHPALRQ